MKIISFKFDRFRTIKDDTLDIEKDITCLVGINEAGKSNVLLGIEKFDQKRELTNEDISRYSEDFLNESVTPSLEVLLEPQNSEERIKLMEAFGLDEVDQFRVVKDGSEYRIDYPRIEYHKSSFFEPPTDAIEEESVLDSDESKFENNALSNDHDDLTIETQKAIRVKVEQLVVSLLPRIFYFDSVDFEQYYLPLQGDVLITELVSSTDTNQPVRNLLTLANINPNDLVKHTTASDKVKRDTRLEEGTRQANEKLLKAYWPVDTVQIQLAADGDTLKIRIKEGRDFLPGERSRGLQWVLAFNIFFLASTNEKLKNSVLLIDEPGIFLHIDGQRRMISKTFTDIAKNGNQIVYSTHLPYLIDKNFPERIRILEKKDGDTSIGNKAWSVSEFGSIPEPVRTALGMNITEAFLFGQKNLVVEGPSDQIYLRLMFQKFDEDVLKALTIVPAYGVEKVPQVMTLALVSNYEAVGLIDTDKDIEEIVTQFEKVGIKDVVIKNVATVTNDTSLITIEDVLPQSLFRAAVFKVYSQEAKRRNRKLDENDIPTDSPRVLKNEEFFRTKLTSSKHKFLKMEVARAVKDLLDGDIVVPQDEWSKVKKLVSEIGNIGSEKKKVG